MINDMSIHTAIAPVYLSAVFNILFVIGICAFVSTTTAQLNWWPVLRDSVYYTFTVLVLIVVSKSTGTSLVRAYLSQLDVMSPRLDRLN